MHYSLLVYQSHSHQSARTALAFAQALVDKGHFIDRVFFYGESVHIAHQAIDTPEDEFNVAKAWQALANAQKVTIQLCVAAAARRGLNEENINTPYELVGLGEFASAVKESERVITFGKYVA